MGAERNYPMRFYAHTVEHKSGQRVSDASRCQFLGEDLRAVAALARRLAKARQ